MSGYDDEGIREGPGRRGGRDYRDDRDFGDDDRGRDDRDVRAALEQVKAPSIGLLATAVIGILWQLVSVVINLVRSNQMSEQATMMGGKQGEQMQMLALFSGTLGIITNVVGILMGGVVIVGSLKMMKLEAFGFAMAVSIISMIPCVSPCCLLGLPVGIWALVTLNNEPVKSAFR